MRGYVNTQGTVKRQGEEFMILESQKFEAIVIEGHTTTRTSEPASQDPWEEKNSSSFFTYSFMS